MNAITPAVVVVNQQDWKPKSSFASDAVIDWVLPPELFVESDQDFNYGLAMVDYFDPAIVDTGNDTGTNLANYWFSMNGNASYPANNGVMRTPVAWFASNAKFSLDVATGWTQVQFGPGNKGVFWILAAFAGVAVINQRKGVQK